MPASGFSRNVSLILASVLFLLTIQSVLGEVDLKRIFLKAANQFATRHGTVLTPTALASGMCFTREDFTENYDKCSDQPTCKNVWLRKPVYS